MEKALRSAVSYTFGSSANPKSNGKSKNSKSNKGDKKATIEFIDKEIICNQEKNEIKEMNQLTSYCGSDGHSYENSEEENEIECSQQQSEHVTEVGESCHISQECGQTCVVVHEEDALSGDETCQQQCGQQEKSCVQQSTEEDMPFCGVQPDSADNQVIQSITPVEVSQQSTVAIIEENAAGVICADSQMVGQSIQKAVESTIIEEIVEVTKTTTIISQESQKGSQTIDHAIVISDSKVAQIEQPIEVTTSVSQESQQEAQIVDEGITPGCYGSVDGILDQSPINTASGKNAVTEICQQSQQEAQSVDAAVIEACYAATPVIKEIDISGQSTVSTESQKKVNVAVTEICQQTQQEAQSVNAAVIEACYAATPVIKEIDISGQSTISTESQKKNDTVDYAVPYDYCREWCGTEEVPKIDINKETIKSTSTKTTETHQDVCKDTKIIHNTTEIIKTEICRELNIEMSLEALSKFSATIEEDSEVLITAKFINPLATPLTDGKFWIEADNLGKPYCFEIPHIDAGETVICRALIFPRCAGYEFIVARFVSREIKRIVGFTNIRVSRAMLCKPTIVNQSVDSSISINQTANQKTIGTKKM